MKKHILGLVLLAGGSLAPLCSAQILFSENFDAQTTGATVTGFTVVSPSTATPLPTGRGVIVVDEGPPNKAARFYDYDTNGNARVEQDFGPLNHARLSLTFRRNADLSVDPGTESTRAFYVTLGYQGLGQGTQANRILEFRLFQNGQFRTLRGIQDSGGNLTSTSVTPAVNYEPSGPTFNTHTLDIFLYSGLPGGPTLSYVGPDLVSRVLDPNSFAVFLDGNFITPPSSPTANGNFGVFQSTFYNATNNIGRFGLVTGGATALTGFDFIVDNIVLSPIPEPSSLALLALGGLALLLRRQRAF
ncbi:MAG: PEP-CTERM sorting domain-containing protein [Verrucomicrobiae bacterium]|nr:PEP-CTERM sorting domain-containing protein [Verrucomicrobiae bacterium]